MLFRETAYITEPGVNCVLKLKTNVNNEIGNMFAGIVIR